MEKELIDRPRYIKKLDALKEQTDLVKVLTGVRRCGKSKILKLFQQKLKKEDKIEDNQIIDINLEDRMQTREIGLELDEKQFLLGYDKLLDYVLSKLETNKLNYVFIDEIQLLRDWQQVANTLRLQDNVDLYITGSNAYMFSTDLANSFGGRYLEIKVQPFSFKEYFGAYNKRLKRDETLSQVFSLQDIYAHYIKESGFPQTLDFFFDRQLINDYLLDTVYTNTIQKDIVKRFNVDVAKLDVVVRYLFDNIGNETSTRGIERGLKQGKFDISVPTIDTYIRGLLDSFLLYKCERYDIKGRQILDSNPKYYVADIGLRTALLGHEDADLGHILENIVYLELLRRGYNVSLGKVYNGGKNVEVDFVAQKSGGKIEYYQVALYALMDEITLKRELAPLEAIDDNYPKYLLSMDFGTGENKGIKRINVLDWLLADDE